MEPGLPPLHPKVPALLARLGLRVIDAFQWNVLLCSEIGSAEGQPLVVVKFALDERKLASIEYEIRVMREALPAMGEEDFERLSLPEYLADGTFEGLRWFTSRYISGQPLRFIWSELSSKPEILGGREIDDKTAVMLVDVLRDLRLVDVDGLPPFVRRFSFGAWLGEFRDHSHELVARGLMRQETVTRALELFQTMAVDRFEGNMFTNGDFYPRNLILLPKGRVAVTDWVGGIDPWEFVAMNAWLMMWGNPTWQQSYLREIKRHFPVDVEDVQVGLLFGAFNRVWQWRERPEQDVGFARSQMLQYFEEFLDATVVAKLLE